MEIIDIFVSAVVDSDIVVFWPVDICFDRNNCCSKLYFLPFFQNFKKVGAL